MVENCLWVLAGLAVLVTLLRFSHRPEWWIRVWDFPRVQIAIFIVAVMAGLLWLGSLQDLATIVVLGALLLCLVYHLWIILPYTRIWPAELITAKGPADDRTLRLVVVNVLMENRSFDGLAQELSRVEPDVILALETDRWWCDRLSDHTERYRYKVLHPLENTYGIFLASRLELVEPEVRFLLKDEVPSIRCGIRLQSGDIIQFFAVHPEPPMPGEADTSIPRDAELVLVGREIAKEPGPSIIAGDLNDVAWSPTSRRFRRLSRMLDPRIGRGFFNTFHAHHWLLRWPLDHVFVSDDFALIDIERLAGFGSDHFPICLTLAYSPRAARIQEPPAPDAEDREEARDTLRQAAGER